MAMLLCLMEGFLYTVTTMLSDKNDEFSLVLPKSLGVLQDVTIMIYRKKHTLCISGSV